MSPSSSISRSSSSLSSPSSIAANFLRSTHLARPLPSHATQPALTPKISSLLLHPSLEAALHILNADLPSAHFLVRHMQAPPAVEGMLLHSILHRCEGDFPNARAWAGDVRDACEGWVPKHRGETKMDDEVARKTRGGEGIERNLLEFVYEGDGEGMERLIDEVQKFRKEGGHGETETEKHIEKRVRQELSRILEWCTAKFGDETFLDASEAWVRDSKEIQKISNDMVSGKEGWRKF